MVDKSSKEFSAIWWYCPLFLLFFFSFLSFQKEEEEKEKKKKGLAFQKKKKAFCPQIVPSRASQQVFQWRWYIYIYLFIHNNSPVKSYFDLPLLCTLFQSGLDYILSKKKKNKEYSSFFFFYPSPFSLWTSSILISFLRT